MSVSQSNVAESSYYLFKTDDKGSVVFVDPALLEQVAKSEDEVRGKHCDRLLPLSDTSFEYERIFEAVKIDQIWEGEVRNAYDNHTKAFQMAVTTSHEDGDAYGYIFILTPKGESVKATRSGVFSATSTAVHAGHASLEHELAFAIPARYKVALITALCAMAMLSIQDASVVNASLLIGMLLVVLLPVLATGLALDKWMLKSEASVLSDSPTASC